MIDITIRNVTKKDLPLIVELIAPFVDQFAINEQGRQCFSSEGIEGILQREGIQYFVAEIQGQFTGVIAYTKPYHLVNFFVAEKYQNKGIGRRLWNFIEDIAIQDNITEFTVNASCNAKSLYEHLGFEQTESVTERTGLRFIPMKKIYNVSNN